MSNSVPEPEGSAKDRAKGRYKAPTRIQSLPMEFGSIAVIFKDFLILANPVSPSSDRSFGDFDSE